MHWSAHATGIREGYVCQAGAGCRRQCDAVCHRLFMGPQSRGALLVSALHPHPGPTCVLRACDHPRTDPIPRNYSSSLQAATPHSNRNRPEAAQPLSLLGSERPGGQGRTQGRAAQSEEPASASLFM